MMKNKGLNIIFIFLMITLLLPINVNAETLTYGKVLDDLSKAKKELEENKKSLGNTQGQIQKDNTTIKNLRAEIEKMKEENTKLQQEIAQANIDIETKEEETKNLMVYLQMSQGENIYLEYVFGSDTITDMVYRLSVVEQITEYNDKTIKELQNLIVKNEERKVELAEKEKQSEQKIENLNTEIAKLNNTVKNLNSIAPSLEDEVKAKESLVSYYKSQGCKNRSDVIGVDCAKTSTNAIFLRPIKNGYVTSFTGYRTICFSKNNCSYSFHKGIDLGSSTGKNTPIYSIGNGIITNVWTDINGAKMVTIQYRDIKGQYYTANYAHLSRYGSGIYVGMKPKEVTSNTIIGYMGDTGKVTGVHLHLEVFPCRLWEAGECSSWSKYEQFARKQFDSGKYKGSESVISFPSITYQTWYTR